MPSGSFKRTKEQNKRMSEALKGNRNALSKAQKGPRKPLTEEHKKKLSESQKHRPAMSAETRRKMGNAQRGSKSHFWKGGVSKQKYPLEFDEVLREQIRLRDGCCVRCKKTDEEALAKHKKSLSIHHIDWDKYNCSEYNLVTLCCGCHMTIHARDKEIWQAILRFIARKKGN